jgi:translation initiation factor IF-2
LAKARRVFEIAKELGVVSKAIVDKCQAEGIPGITNHMSTVKLGLEATIKEWFHAANGGTATAVETAEKVDPDKVRARRRRARPAGEEGHADHGDLHHDTVEGDHMDDVAAAVAHPVEESPAVSPESPMEPAAAAEPELPVVSEEQPAEVPVDEAPPQPRVRETEPPRVAASAPTEAPAAPSHPAAHAAPPAAAAPAGPQAAHVRPAGRPNVPSRPQVVRPAGEQLERPKEAVLKGPRVVRIEQPEPMAAPRPRRPAGPPQGGGGGAGGGGGGGGSSIPGITRSRGPARGRGAGGPAPMAEPESGRPKRRSLSTRRGRSAEAVQLGPSQFSEQDLIELDARLKGAPGFLKQRRRTLKKPGQGATAAGTPAQTGGKVSIEQPVTIKSLSAATGLKSTDIIKYLFQKGIMATINSAIAPEAAVEVAMEYEIDLEVKEKRSAAQLVEADFENREAIDVRSRPPIVTVLGHVDHGKTSLLDRIRHADVAAHEDGGITQHVGAYRVTVQGGDGKEKTVVFLDTPGHQAFTSMRARGAQLTDLVVLVVAADDGVMPQTIESINHAKAAGVPIIVALNKIDKAEATEGNVRKIFGQLAEHGLNPAEWGGETEVVKVSATQGVGITDLMEVLDYQAELLDLKADYGGPARGTVIESEMQPGRGPVARVLVQQGKMKVGDQIVIGRAYGRVRDMSDDRGRSLREAGPATPLELSGIDMIPDAGDKFFVTDSLAKAENVAQHFREIERELQLANQTKVTLDNFAAQIKAGQTRDLRVVLKADVQGSIDVLRKSLEELGNDEVSVKVLHSGVGGVTESDVLLADASDAIVIGFHVVAPPAVREIAEQRSVDIRLYRVIYDVTDNVKKALEGMLEPERKEEQVGIAEVRQTFKITKLGMVAGCLVTDGTIQRSARMRVVRDGVVVTDNREIDSLRRVKEDVREVRAGTECGIKLVNFDDLKPGDQLVCYNTITIERKLG